jgi:hypothetical protein
MKNCLIVIFAFAFQFSYAQFVPDYEQVKLIHPSDYKQSERYALNAANYLLSTPFEKDNAIRTRSLQFLTKWMSGTPDYGFTLDGVAVKIIKGNNDLLGLYMAAMGKYSLENKSSADINMVRLNAIKLLLAYCENPANNMKMTKGLKKLSDANKKGELEKSLAEAVGSK